MLHACALALLAADDFSLIFVHLQLPALQLAVDIFCPPAGLQARSDLFLTSAVACLCAGTARLE